MRKDNVGLTVLTPTFNRANLLWQLYGSLCNQTCKDFQWLIIDDGSTDDTELVIGAFIEENNINLDYYKKENNGKHTALNYAHPYIKGKYLVIVDSDDYLTDNAVEIILTMWKKYTSMNEIVGITFQRGKKCDFAPFDSEIVGEYISTYANEINRGMRGDHCETIRTERFLEFTFPTFPNERFIAEGAMWYEMTKNYKVVYSEQIIYLAEYLDEGLTRSGRGLFIRNPRGCMWQASKFLNKDFNMKMRMKNALLLNCYGRFIGVSRKEILTLVDKEKGLIVLAWIPSLFLYLFWKKKYNV